MKNNTSRCRPVGFREVNGLLPSHGKPERMRTHCACLAESLAIQIMLFSNGHVVGLTDSTLCNYHTITRTIVLGNPYYRVNDLLIDLRQTFHDCFQPTFGKIVGALN